MLRSLDAVLDVMRVPASGDASIAVVPCPAVDRVRCERCAILVVGGGTGGVAAALAAATAALAVAGFGLRQSASASALPASPAYVGTADWGFSVDNLGVGSTFDDACAIPTPTRPATWGQVKGLYR